MYRSQRAQGFLALLISTPFVVRLVVLSLALSIPATTAPESQIGRATTHLSAEILLERAALTSPQLEALQEGKVVAFGLAQLELEPEQLAAILLVLVSAKVPDVAMKIVDRISLQTHEGAPMSYDLEGEADDVFGQAVVLGSDEAAEINRLLRVHSGDEFNFSTEEIRWFQAVAADVPQGGSRYANATKAMKSTLRRVLQTRYQVYRARGLNGIAPYDRGRGEAVDPGEGLRFALDSINLLRIYFPRFYLAFREYPAAGAEAYKQRHVLIKQITRGRPAFVLAHWMVDINESYALIAERQYYVSHTYDILQNMIACLPYRGGTLVALLNQTFTGKVTGFARGIRHDVGRKRIQKTIQPLFKSLRNAFARD
jgi:hypothetical protein